MVVAFPRLLYALVASIAFGTLLANVRSPDVIRMPQSLFKGGCDSVEQTNPISLK